MPELPDVEIFRRVLADGGLHRRVASVDLRDPDTLRDARPADLEDALVGRTFESAGRHGKVAFACVRGGGVLAIHFGMTGFLAIAGRDEPDTDHARLAIAFRGGTRLLFDDTRRFGWVEIADGVEAYVERAGLGPDALAIEAEAFAALVGGSRATIKAALMDQDRIAGIGNVYSDEILFAARIAPHARAADLGTDRIDRLFAAMRTVLEEAIAAGADPGRMPADWLTPHREAGERCPRCGETLAHERVSGRTAWFCPRCQSV